MNKTIVISIFLVLFLPLIHAQASQQSSQQKKGSRPVLIRDDKTMQEEVPEGETIELDPVKAKKSFEIAEYYFKSQHYDAALMRFREAIQYDPDFEEAKWMFIHTLEKKEDWENLKEFAESYLNSDNVGKRKGKIESALKKAEKELSKHNR